MDGWVIDSSGTCQCLFLDQNWFRIATHPVVVLLFVVVLVGATSSKTVYGFVVSSRTGMIFGRNVLRVNTHRLTKSDFWSDVIIIQNGGHDMCCHLVSENEASAARICPKARQFLICNIHSYLFVWPIRSVSLRLCMAGGCDFCLMSIW